MVFSLHPILNISLNLQMQFISETSQAYFTFFSMMLKSTSFPLTVPICTSDLGKIVLYSHLSFTAADSLKSEKDWPVDFAQL